MKKTAVFLFLFFSLKLSAQLDSAKIFVGGVSGYAFYNQGDLKFINQSVSEQLPFEVSVVDNFKPVLYFGAYAQFNLGKHFLLGPFYEYHSTGSRLGRKDYSGMFYFDQYVNVNIIGLKMDYSVYNYKKSALNLELNTGISLTDWQMKSVLVLGDDNNYDEDIDNFKGHSIIISPAIKYLFLVLPHVYLAGGVTCSFDINRKYAYEKDKNADIVKTPNWSGLKLFLEIGIYI